jgi:hypothetical protein
MPVGPLQQAWLECSTLIIDLPAAPLVQPADPIKIVSTGRRLADAPAGAGLNLAHPGTELLQPSALPYLCSRYKPYLIFVRRGRAWRRARRKPDAFGGVPDSNP